MPVVLGLLSAVQPGFSAQFEASAVSVVQPVFSVLSEIPALLPAVSLPEALRGPAEVMLLPGFRQLPASRFLPGFRLLHPVSIPAAYKQSPYLRLLLQYLPRSLSPLLQREYLCLQ